MKAVALILALAVITGKCFLRFTNSNMVHLMFIYVFHLTDAFLMCLYQAAMPVLCDRVMPPQTPGRTL